ncbi:MAG: hypothetical protein M5U25_16285 [Planctomycetota bacterium]|nr:hypothetical protein [Planctomycetota bacterium]
MNAYHILADFLLFSALFISAAYVGHRPSIWPSGIAVSLSVILAVAITAAGPMFGFSVRSWNSPVLVLFC